jgi:hypothetical protein
MDAWSELAAVVVAFQDVGGRRLGSTWALAWDLDDLSRLGLMPEGSLGLAKASAAEDPDGGYVLAQSALGHSVRTWVDLKLEKKWSPAYSIGSCRERGSGRVCLWFDFELIGHRNADAGEACARDLESAMQEGGLDSWRMRLDEEAAADESELACENKAFAWIGARREARLVAESVLESGSDRQGASGRL